MKKKHSILHKVLSMIAATGIIIGAVIITAGAISIYKSTEDGIKTEITMAAKTLNKLYVSMYDGDLSYENGVCRIGDKLFDETDFVRLTECIACDDDVDFTLFYGDTRIFTSVLNDDSTLAVGTTAASYVVKNVIDGGSDYISLHVLVNDKYYMGYYIPITSASGGVAGMLFAGKPTESAEANALKAVIRFIVLAVLTLIIAIFVCVMVIKRMIADLGNIKSCLGELADGNFNASLSPKTTERADEIGELARYSVRVRENLRDMVERDPMTSLLNRRSCMKHLDELRDTGTGYSVVMGDIDFFKKINDTYGHAAGDFVLKTVSSMLRDCACANGGWAVRWGGEEFLLIFPDNTINNTLPHIEDLLSEIRAANPEYEGEKIAITMTFGISDTSDGKNPEKTINEADARLYYGKKNGRNRIVSNDESFTV